MKHPENLPLVTTISEHCRVCYTCVRECPAKAIRITEGQAEVIPERCIGCGNCVRVCSQGAKQVLDACGDVLDLLEGEDRVAAIVAPSFPAEFPENDHMQVVGMLRALGFDSVHEVAFGADLVAEAYRDLLTNADAALRYIATSCPAIVGYVERYAPGLVPALAPIVSPMVAMARALRQLDGRGEDMRIVFIGPCIAKKGEAASREVQNEIDAALTFAELQSLLEAKKITAGKTEPVDFDPPHAGPGALFAISRGLLQAAKIEEDLIAGQVVAADGRMNFVEAIREFETGDLDARLLEVLCCNGCIMGAGMTCDIPKFRRRSRVSQFVRQRWQEADQRAWRQYREALADLDLSRGYNSDDQRIPEPSAQEMAAIFARMGKFDPEDELNCGACGYDTCREHAVAIHKNLAESEMCLPYTIEQLRTTVSDLAVSNERLANTREALMHSERLASMGQLAAGVAHEVNNPLGVVLMYAHLLLEEYSDQDTETREDLAMIVEQADRCKKIVARLLDFARQNKVVLQPTNLRELVDSNLRVIKIPDAIKLSIEHEPGCDPVADLDGDQVTQVLINLASNAVDAMPEGGELKVTTDGTDDEVILTVTDTGTGIPEDHRNKVFEPFFTSKQMGKGTGLGLAVTYGIIKMHRGDIRIESNTDPAMGPTGTKFTVHIPRHGEAPEPIAAPAEEE